MVVVEGEDEEEQQQQMKPEIHLNYFERNKTKSYLQAQQMQRHGARQAKTIATIKVVLFNVISMTTPRGLCVS